MKLENQKHLVFEEVNAAGEMPCYPVILCKHCKQGVRVISKAAHRMVQGDGLCTDCFKVCVKWAKAIGDDVGKAPKVGNASLRRSPRWLLIVNSWQRAQIEAKLATR